MILAEWQCHVMARRESIPIDVPIFGDSSDSASSRCLRVERVRVKAVTGNCGYFTIKKQVLCNLQQHETSSIPTGATNAITTAAKTRKAVSVQGCDRVSELVQKKVQCWQCWIFVFYFPEI